ncbi:MAG: CsgG/HfaB family protein [Anaerovibrio sp.]
MINMLVNLTEEFKARIKHGVAIAAIAVLGSSSVFSVAQAADIHSYPTVAVMQFGNKAITSQGMRAYDFDSASEYAIYQLLASGWFDLVDYEQLGNIAKMHEINMSGLVDQSTAVQLGKFAGAQFMVVGNVTGLTTKTSGIDYQHGKKGGAGVAIRTVIANVAIRIVDIETGTIVGAGLGKGESTSSSVEIVFKKYRKPKNIVTTGTDVDPYRMGGSSDNNDDEGESSNNNDSGDGSNSSSDGSQTDNDTSIGDVDTELPYEDEQEAYEEDNEINIDVIEENDTSSIGVSDSSEDIVIDNAYNVSRNIGGVIINDNLLKQLTDSRSMAHFVDDSGSSEPESSPSDTEVDTGSPSSNEEVENYRIRIGSQDFSAVQVRNAISKAVRDAIYGDMGLMTMLNDGKKLKVKTGF